jgi:hypothetical protein
MFELYFYLKLMVQFEKKNVLTNKVVKLHHHLFKGGFHWRKY